MKLELISGILLAIIVSLVLNDITSKDKAIEAFDSVSTTVVPFLSSLSRVLGRRFAFNTPLRPPSNAFQSRQPYVRPPPPPLRQRPPPPPRPVSPSPNVDWMNGPLHSLCDDIPSQYKKIWSPLDSEYTFTEVVVEYCGWTQVEDHHNATLVWTTGHSDMPNEVKSSLRFGKGQIWSQLEDGWVFADKVRLHKLLKHVGRLDYQPPTFILLDQEECVSFFRELASDPGSVWITKEPSNSQGMGIMVNPDHSVLRQNWLEDPNVDPKHYKCKVSSKKDYLVQRYLLDPLLLEGKKMEIRSYWVVASTEPYVIIYHDGTVRLTTREYKHGEWSDPLIHITNTKQQKLADPNYYLTEAERKWTLEHMASYLKDNGYFEESEEEWLDKLREMLKERIAVAAIGAHGYLLSKKDLPGWDGRFELFGMDVILDQKLYPWLTELQDGPSLSLDPGVKQEVIPKLLKELVNIELEIDTSLRAGRPLSNPLLSLGSWHQIDLNKYSNLVHIIPGTILTKH